MKDLKWLLKIQCMLLSQTWKHIQREKYALAIDLKKIEKSPPCTLPRPLKHTHHHRNDMHMHQYQAPKHQHFHYFLKC